MTDGKVPATAVSATFRLGEGEFADWNRYVRHHLGDADSKWIWASAGAAFLIFLLVQRRDVAAGAVAVWGFALLVSGLVAAALVWERRWRWRRHAQTAARLNADEVTIEVTADGIVLRTATSHEVHPWADVLGLERHLGVHVVALHAPPETVRGVILPAGIPPSVLDAVRDRLAAQPTRAPGLDDPRS